MTLLPRHCKLCGLFTREVVRKKLPVTEYMTWLSWVCIDAGECNKRMRARQ